MSDERPAGVIALSALCAIVGVACISFVALLVVGHVPLSSGAFLLGRGLEQLGPAAFLLYATIMLVLALALWRRWRWARRAAILVALIGIAMAVPALSSAVTDSRTLGILREGLQIILRVAIVYYLSQEPVKQWFAKR